MRLVDHVVSTSLDLDNACLRLLAHYQQPVEAIKSREPPAQGVYAENPLAGNLRRLASFWTLLKPLLDDEKLDGKKPIARHIARLEKESHWPGGMTNAGLAKRLCTLAPDEETRNAMGRFADVLNGDDTGNRARIADAVMADSELWRSGELFSGVLDTELVERFNRAYRKAWQMARKVRHSSEGLTDRLERFLRRTQVATHTIELLDGPLSEDLKSVLWHLEKLSDTLRLRAGLGELGDVLDDAPLKLSHAEIVRAYITSQANKMDKRSVRLASGSFTLKPDKAARELARAVDQLNLRDIELLNPEEMRQKLMNNEHKGVG